MYDSEFVGVNEFAKLAGVTRQAVVNWRARVKTFPRPVADLSSGPVFRLSQVRSWLKTRGAKMTHIISTINLKGGVGKTTTTVALAEAFSSEFSKKVLVIDLDPQTNATVMLIGEKSWSKRNKAGKTLATLFNDAVEQKKEFDLEETLVKEVSDITSAASIDLLPSSIDMIDIQDRLASIPSGKFYSINPVDLLSRAVQPIVDNYDIILVDCPPNLGIITLNGLRLSHGFLIPTIPDVLSTYGIPQIVSRVGEFSDSLGIHIAPLGIIVSKYQSNSTVHKTVLGRLQSSGKEPVFSTIIPQANQISGAAEFEKSSRTFKQKYGYDGLATQYYRLAKEILDKLEA